ncbi:MAG: helix-turn-helix domain-containing protein [Candidatus Acidiferrales bacterium]
MNSEKSALISKLKSNKKFREAYIRAKASVNIPSQLRALRLRREMTQKELASTAEMAQPRISAMERPGVAQFNLDTLVRLAAAFNVALIVKFASFGEMLKWENEFSQDDFNVTPIEKDIEFATTDGMAPSYQGVAATPIVYLSGQFSEGFLASKQVFNRDWFTGKDLTIFMVGGEAGQLATPQLSQEWLSCLKRTEKNSTPILPGVDDQTMRD